MPLRLHVRPGDTEPIYAQIVRQVAAGIAAGRLAPGERLPALRDLARTLVVAPLTVKKAYDELERQGFVEVRHGRGCFVAEAPPVVAAEERDARLRVAVRRLLEEAWLLGADLPEVLALLEEENA